MRKQLAICAVLLAACGVVAAHALRQRGTKPAVIFDGRSLAGWEGNARLFRVESGAIVGGTLTAPIAQNEFLCTRREYSNFVLRLKFKLLGDMANAGVQFRSQRIAGDNEVIGYQADMGDGWWGSLYDESRRNTTLARPDAARVNAILKKNDWNSYEIRADAARIRLRLNDMETVDYTEPDGNIKQTGVICLQIHSGKPSEAWYKDISIEELP